MVPEEGQLAFSIQIELQFSSMYYFVIRNSTAVDSWYPVVDPRNNDETNILTNFKNERSSFISVSDDTLSKCKVDGKVGYQSRLQECTILTECKVGLEKEITAPTDFTDRVCGSLENQQDIVEWFTPHTFSINIIKPVTRVGILGSFNNWKGEPLWMTEVHIKPASQMTCSEIPSTWFFTSVCHSILFCSSIYYALFYMSSILDIL